MTNSIPYRAKQRARRIFLLLGFHLLLALTVVLAAQAAQAVASPVVEGIGAVSMVVSDMDRSVDFYSQVLTFEMVSDVEVFGSDIERLQGLFGVRMRVVRMRLGDEFIELAEFLTPQGRPMPVNSRSNDRCFQHVAIIVSDMDRAYQRLREHKVKHVSTGPQLLPAYIKPAAGIRAFYFRDPDGHFLEILQFPPDKGDAKWHRPGAELFLGIDHTAIVVADTDVSLRFYRDTLGLRVAGESENYGTEQEHLNNVFGARLRITALRAAQGSGIELIEYLAPRDGRPMPSDSRANDLWAWRTTLVTSDASDLAIMLRGGKYPPVSSGLVNLLNDMSGFKTGLLLRDPDGHIMQFLGSNEPN
jgi:catechol 2,3-dioxygenase-like lactoylglutathione lyase family enzyme